MKHEDIPGGVMLCQELKSLKPSPLKEADMWGRLYS
jgi:hypothetical protein